MLAVLFLIITLTLVMTAIVVVILSKIGKVNEDIEHIFEEIALHQKRVEELQSKIDEPVESLDFMTPEIAESQSDLVEEEEKKAEDNKKVHKNTLKYAVGSARFCKYRRQGMTIKQASDACGVALGTGYRYEKVYIATVGSKAKKVQ